MKKSNKLKLAIFMLFAFVLWTAAICLIDEQAIGPRGSKVGFATLNAFFHAMTGVHMSVYVITDWLGLVPLAFGVGFASLGLVQWIKRKNICKVDRKIRILGIFYLVVFTAYVLFDMFAVNYRPVLINGYLEPSYPSSTTMLVLCVMPTAMMILRRQWFRILSSAFIAFMVIGRAVSGVHWVTDIIGGIFLSIGLVMLYAYLIED